VYPVIFIDGIRIKVRDSGTVANKVAHLVVGVELESAVQPGQRVLTLLGKLRSDPRPSLGGEHLSPLIVTGEAIVGDQTFMDHTGLQTQVGTQPKLH
jgi:hypothetical protein